MMHSEMKRRIQLNLNANGHSSPFKVFFSNTKAQVRATASVVDSYPKGDRVRFPDVLQTNPVVALEPEARPLDPTLSTIDMCSQCIVDV